MSGQDVRIKSGPDGEFGGYLASPVSGRGPGLVVIQEIFGVNAVMRTIADEFAARGYFALAPDLFWRLEPGVQLSDRTDAEWKRAFDLMGRFDQDSGVKDIQTSINYLRHSVAGCTGKVGAVGYCLGGLLAFLTATRTDCDASVGYYGVNIQEKLAEAAKIRKPVMLHVAGKDEYVPKEAQALIVASLKNHPQVELHTYPGREHAFARMGGEHYHAA